MNHIQFNRWKDFAIRMSLYGWPIKDIQEETHQEVVIPAITHFFRAMKEEFKDVLIRIESWDNTRADYSKKDYYGHPETGPYVGDIVEEMFNEENPYYYDDQDSPKKYEAWDEEWGSRIRCCIRAGMDIAVNPSGGVLGFVKQDIERMYPEGVPKWIQKDWGEENGEWRNVAWKDIPATEGVWL